MGQGLWTISLLIRRISLLSAFSFSIWSLSVFFFYVIFFFFFEVEENRKQRTMIEKERKKTLLLLQKKLSLFPLWLHILPHRSSPIGLYFFCF